MKEIIIRSEYKRTSVTVNKNFSDVRNEAFQSKFDLHRIAGVNIWISKGIEINIEATTPIIEDFAADKLMDGWNPVFDAAKTCEMRLGKVL